ncbi:1-aminocyclopropane-1-carboxylate deaminase/D-cysteine desulfhydrase [Actinoplanes sp. NPDC051513]|uniref:1-aminocyclopropane-1-carboxylate deaminase/D-cysteine desulfhydrase n=1 Tax=Actinoplanes sp. NPDC051513 TaxID=3363908 RepID=UPI00379B2462
MFRLPSPLRPVDDERLTAAGIRMFLKRDDLIHPDFPGNKWRKLKYNIEAAQRAGHTTLLTFGGAFSNHLLATAAAGHHFPFTTVGIVRGEHRDPLNPVLAAAVRHGMRLEYVDRSRYRQRSDKVFLEHLSEKYGNPYLIPEGGANEQGVRGCAELVDEIGIPFDILSCSVGTGATLAGVATRLSPTQRAIGYAALKGDFLRRDVECLQKTPTTNWEIDTSHHFGGYAKRTRTLDVFIEDFRDRHGVTLNRVYEAKMMYGIFADLSRFTPGTTVVVLIA